MQTKNIIQATANVIKITNLKKGDVVKKIGTRYQEAEISYAIVLDMMNDGENTFIEMLEYEKSYGDIKSTIKVYKGGDDLSIFPADIEEVKEYMQDTVKGIEQKIEDKKEELQKLIDGLGKAKEFVSGELSRELSSPEYKELTQRDYDQQKADREARLKELQQAQELA